MEVAWNASAPRNAGPASYASAALRLELSWTGGPGRASADCRAALDAAGRVTAVPLPACVGMELVRHGGWTHLLARTDDGTAILQASFEHGRLAFCRSCVPERAGLRGGSYESPTAILESYGDAAAAAGAPRSDARPT